MSDSPLLPSLEQNLSQVIPLGNLTTKEPVVSGQQHVLQQGKIAMGGDSSKDSALVVTPKTEGHHDSNAQVKLGSGVKDLVSGAMVAMTTIQAGATAVGNAADNATSNAVGSVAGNAAGNAAGNTAENLIGGHLLPSANAFKRHCYSLTMRGLMYLCTGLTVALVLFLIGYILVQAVPYFSIEILTTKPSYLRHTIGVLPDILNTIYLIIAALVLVLPLGVGAAIYLNEYASSKRLVHMIEYAIETLAGIPSIIYGLVGMLIFCEFLGLQTSLLAGALTLVIMTLPTIIRTTQESLKTVPQGYREGALGLGAAKFRVIKTVVLPCCSDGIVTGCILAVGRMLGESAALLFTAGFAHSLHGFFEGLTNSGATLTVALYVYAKEQGQFEVAFVIAAILLVMSLGINILATTIANRFKRRIGTARA